MLSGTLAYFLYYYGSLAIVPVLAVTTPIVKPIELKVSLGNTTNEFKFFPDRVQLVAGKNTTYYYLIPVLKNIISRRGNLPAIVGRKKLMRVMSK